MSIKEQTLNRINVKLVSIDGNLNHYKASVSNTFNTINSSQIGVFVLDTKNNSNYYCRINANLVSLSDNSSTAFMEYIYRIKNINGTTTASLVNNTLSADPLLLSATIDLELNENVVYVKVSSGIGSTVKWSTFVETHYQRF